MKFTKMHGCGNDYVYVNLFEEKIADPAKVSIAVSDRHFGIGSDGLITIGPSDIADFRMRIYNADGSEAVLALKCLIGLSMRMAVCNCMLALYIISLLPVKDTMRLPICTLFAPS